MNSIDQLFSSIEVDLVLYDLGRHVKEISRGALQRLESGAAWSLPCQRQAHLAIGFWPPEQQANATLWFLKFPLDEQARLAPFERDQFLQQLLQAAGKNLRTEPSNASFTDAIGSTAYAFTPSKDKQAVVNSHLRLHLEQPACDDYANAVKVVTQQGQGWENLSLQGLADYSSRWQGHRDELINALPHLPQELSIQCLQLLEHESVDEVLGEVLLQLLLAHVAEENPALAMAALRGLSGCTSMALREVGIKVALQAPAQQADWLTLIAARYPLSLTDTSIADLFLNALSLQPQKLIQGILLELLFIPSLRPHLLSVLAHHPYCTETLQQHIRQQSLQ